VVLANALHTEAHAVQPGRAATTARLRVYEGGTGGLPGPQEVVCRVRRALVALRDPTSIERLEVSIPTAVGIVGFERVVYARLRGAEWSHAASLPCAGEPNSTFAPVVLDASFEEYPILDQRVPVVVGLGCARRLLPAEWCRTYLLAPVVERGAAVGLIHAGFHDPDRKPSALDREMLGTLTEALAPIFASARADEALRDLMANISHVAAELGRLGPSTPPSAGATSALTGREREVLELMAAGQTNGQIARRLVITEGTAKSHVKRIMRKLHAANRAEAVAAWIRPAERAAVMGAGSERFAAGGI
jgi:DNA-binding NarL/FixJ family response regulator